MNPRTITADPATRTLDLPERDPNAQTAMRPYQPPSGALAIPNRDEWTHLLEVSKHIRENGFANPGLNTDGKVALAVLKGREVGLPMLMAVQEINVIYNRPSLSAVAMRALLEGKGCKVRDIQYTDTVAEVEITRPDNRVAKQTFTIQDAQRMWTKENEKACRLSETQRYQQNPALMLNNRCLSRLARRFCADIVFGMAVEDADDDGQVIDVQASPAPPAPFNPDVPAAGPAPAVEVKPAAPAPPPPAELLRQRLEAARGNGAPAGKVGF